MIPKLFNCLEKDTISTINYALMTNEELVVTNNHIIVIHKMKELFDEEFCKSIPKKGLLIDAEILKTLADKKVNKIKYENNSIIITIASLSYKKIFENITLNGEAGTFPNYKTIWPKEQISIHKINLNPKLLNDIYIAMGEPKYGIKLEFYGEYKEVVCKPNCDKYISCKAIIMPIKL